MKKEFNADTCTVEEGVINCLEYEIENNAETDKDKERIAKSISDAVRDGHINSGDAKKLLKKLGVEPPKDDAETFNAADAKAWEETLRGKYEELRSAALKIKALKDELKDARKVYSQIQDEINAEAGQGSKDFKARERTLFDGVEE